MMGERWALCDAAECRMGAGGERTTLRQAASSPKNGKGGNPCGDYACQHLLGFCPYPRFHRVVLRSAKHGPRAAPTLGKGKEPIREKKP